MKKVKNFLLGNIKIMIAFVVGGIVFGGTATVIAVTVIESSQVPYTPPSGSSATNVQDALDEINTKVNTGINPNNNFGTPQYYAFGTYKGWCWSTDTNCNSYADFPTTSTTSAPSGKNVYAAKYADGGYGVCINRNGTPHCFRGRNWIAEAQHIQKVFSGANDSCDVYSSYVDCDASDFNCYVRSDGYVGCYDYGTDAGCYVDDRGFVECDEW